MNNKFGEVSWNDEVQVGNGDRKNVKDLFMKLEKGSNIVRIITTPHLYMQHRWKPEGDPASYGYRVMCSAVHGSCPICSMGGDDSKAKRRWLLGVIDRKTNSYKILDVSVMVFKAVQGLVKDEDWGNPDKYDIDIKVDQTAGPAGYYTVNPKPHKPLTATDLSLKDNADLEELKRRVSPPTPDKVQERLDKLMANSPLKAAAGTATPAVKNGKVATADLTDDTDTDFPDHDTVKTVASAF